MLPGNDYYRLQPLKGWMDTLVRFVRSDQVDLTNRQMAILMLVYLSDGPHTVRGLAGRLAVSKPVVTRALNTLGALGYIRRKRDDNDLRNIFVERTTQGQEFLERFASMIGETVGDSQRYGTARPAAALRPAS
jgi:DNA-binding MarR family transcriptional regulator